jgi:uncharacterized membrane protein YGL010W
MGGKTVLTADQWFEAYGESHQNPTNKRIHWVCVPLITMSLLGLLWSLPSPFPWTGINWATVALAAVIAFYTAISRRLALGMLGLSAVMLLGIMGLEGLSETVPLWASSLSVFVIGWIGQFVGHHIEGKKPSFFDDLRFLLIGPLWVLGYAFRKLGIGY